jgi:serine/threonine-protein kinase
MGAVYVGEHSIIGRQAAIKLLLPELSANAEVVTRFFNEARATARIRHPGIVEIFDCGTVPSGQAYIVMELLDGETLGSYIQRQGKLADHPDVASALVRQVAAAVSAAHARGIIHRDLKPDNIFLCNERGGGERATVKVLDFGIAKLVSAQLQPITTIRQLLGTPHYMSPEQCQRSKDLDARADVYSLGCIAFELLTGLPVFEGDSLTELVSAHMYREPTPLRKLEPGVPRRLADLVHRMLAKRPADRPDSMEAIVAAIDALDPRPAVRGGAVALPAGWPLVRRASPLEGLASLRACETIVASGRPDEVNDGRPPEKSEIPGVAAEEPPRAAETETRSLKWAMAGLAVAAIGAVVLVARFHEPGRRSAAAPAHPASIVKALPTIGIDVADPPPHLVVAVDGRLLSLPLSLPRGPESHTLVFTAPGYEPMTRTVDATKTRTLVLQMQRELPTQTPTSGPAATPKPAAPSGARKQRTRRPRTDLFLDI